MFNLLKKKIEEKIEKLENKLECQHTYIYYNRTADTTVSRIYPPTIYHFVCNKCEDTIRISSDEIQDKVDEYNEWYKKQIALNKMEKLEPESFMLWRISDLNVMYNSVGAKLTIDYYKQKGIDITKLGIE